MNFCSRLGFYGYFLNFSSRMICCLQVISKRLVFWLLKFVPYSESESYFLFSETHSISSRKKNYILNWLFLRVIVNETFFFFFHFIYLFLMFFFDKEKFYSHCPGGDRIKNENSTADHLFLFL